MPFPKIGFAKRLLLLYAGIFILVILVTDWSLSRAVEKRELASLHDSLSRQSALVSQFIGPLLGDRPALQSKVRQLTEGTGTRITVIDPEGAVLADSGEPADAVAGMDNHALRPEIAAALRKTPGTSTRYSMTLKTRMLYVAVPVLAGADLRGVVRTAMPLTRVDEILSEARRPIVLSVFAGVIVVLLTGILFANRLTGRIRRITSVAERYAEEDWAEKVLIDGQDELKMLGDTMNHMASVLQSRIRELESEKSKASAILSNMTDAVIAIDRRKGIVMANPTAELLFGISSTAIRGKSLIEATRHPYLETVVDQAFRERRTAGGEIQLAGAERKVLRISVVVTEKNVRDIGGIIVLHDVTELRRLENIRKEFVANASHELRTPLTSIKGFIETLLGGAMKDPDSGERFLRIMQEDAIRLGRLVEDILTLGEIEQGAAPLKKDPVCLATEIREVLERFKFQANEKKIVLENRLPESGPVIPGDRDKVRQVFVNLIDNAIKFNREGGKVILTAAQDTEGVQVSVEDTGVGIPKDALGRVFERFFRVDKARSRELGGTGLGLAIVKHIMEAHGGRASCESVPGSGSKFTVFFQK